MLEETHKIKVKVHGHLLKELSEKLPSYSIALNELLKNAYDACAKKVSVLINSKDSTIVIKDDGTGMSYTTIEGLFHLSQSTKVYGSISECGRPTQGSKGLGFLSVFKLGSFVKWITVHNNVKSKFEFDYSEAVKIDNLTDFDINYGSIEQIEPSYTEIFIQSSPEIISSLINYYSDDKILQKIIHSFLDDSFIVQLSIDEKSYSSEDKVNMEKILPERLLYRVKYKTADKKIHFYYKDRLLSSIEYPHLYNDFVLDIDLVIFEFVSGNSKKVPSLYQSPIKNSITPLVFTNNNFFANYTLWNTEILRYLSSSSVLPQMIGTINIISSSPKMDFNAERTDFVENELTKSIVFNFSELNKLIQLEGSKMKPYLKDLDYVDENILLGEDFVLSEESAYKAIKSDFYFKDNVSIKIKGNIVIFDFLNIQKTYTTVQKSISYKNVEIIHDIPSIWYTKKPQLDIKKKIQSIKNSLNQNIIDSIRIKIDGKDTNILKSYDTPCNVAIEITYDDPNTGDFIFSQTIAIEKEDTKVNIPIKPLDLIDYGVVKGYTILVSTNLASLVTEINSLYRTGPRAFYVLATSIRSVFELCILELIKNNKLSSIIRTSIDDGNNVTVNVAAVVSYSKKQKSILDNFAKALGESPRGVKALLDASEYEIIMGKCNLGAHTSMLHLTTENLSLMGKKAGYFVVLCNEIIKDTSIS